MLSLTVNALRGGFWGFSALVSGVTTCTFYAPEIMIAVFLRVAVPLAPLAFFLRGEGKMLLRMPSDPHHWVMWESIGCRCHTH